MILVENCVNSNGGLAGLMFINDELTLTTSDGLAALVAVAVDHALLFCTDDMLFA